MTKVQIKRTATPNAPPITLDPGELSVEMSNPTRLWVGVPPVIDPTGKKLLVDLSAAHGGVIVSDTPPTSPLPGQLWWESDSGMLLLFYDDGNSQQWVACTTSGLKGDPGINAPGRAHGQCRLKLVSPTEIRLYPHNGDGLICNGKVCSIPLAGLALAVTGLPLRLTTTNRILTSNVETLTISGGVPASWAGAVAAGAKVGIVGVGGASNKDGTKTLSAQTATQLSFPLTAANETTAADTLGQVYPILYVYAVDSNNDQIVDTLEWSWTGYTLSAGGVWTKTGDPTRTLVGVVTPGFGGVTEFSDGPQSRLVRSFFNAVPASVTTPDMATALAGITGTTSEYPPFRFHWLQWAHETALIVGTASILNSAAAANATTSIWYDGTTGYNSRATEYNDSSVASHASMGPSYLVHNDNEGFHYGNLAYSVGSGSGTLNNGSGVRARVG